MSEDEWVDVSEAPLLADVTWLHAQNGSEPTVDSWAPRNLADMEDRPPVQPTLGGLGIVYPGKRHVFSGPQESAKTLAAYVVGLYVVRQGRKVVLIDFEMGPWDAKQRLRELGATDDDLGGFLYVEPETPASAASVGRLVGLEPALVIVDAAAGAFQLEGLDDNSRRDVERWAGSWVIPFWRAGIATIVLDHVTKNVEARGNYAIGSERKVGGVDVHLGFSVLRPISRGDHGLYKVMTHKDRGGCLKRGHLCDFKLTSDPDTHSISWEFVAPQPVDEEHPFEPTHLMEKVSRYLELVHGTVNMSTIERDVEGKRDYLRTAVDRLVARGFADESAGPNRQRLIESIEPYRETFDSSPQVRPESAPEPGIVGSPARPSPFRGGQGETFAPGEDSSPPPTLDDIPF